MKLHSLRLKPGQDLRRALVDYARRKGIRAGSIVTCAGSLASFTLRMAGSRPDKQNVRRYDDSHEIVSLTGTITGDSCHLHIALSDRKGAVVGGHLREGSSVDTTAEVVIAEHEGVVYKRSFDEQTGFEELEIEES